MNSHCFPRIHRPSASGKTRCRARSQCRAARSSCECRAACHARSARRRGGATPQRFEVFAAFFQVFPGSNSGPMCQQTCLAPHLTYPTYTFTFILSEKTETNDIKHVSHGLLGFTARSPLQIAASPPPPALPTDPQSFRPPDPAGARWGRATWWAIHVPSPVLRVW